MKKNETFKPKDKAPKFRLAKHYREWHLLSYSYVIGLGRRGLCLLNATFDSISTLSTNGASATLFTVSSVQLDIAVVESIDSLAATLTDRR